MTVEYLIGLILENVDWINADQELLIGDEEIAWSSVKKQLIDEANQLGLVIPDVPYQDVCKLWDNSKQYEQ